MDNKMVISKMKKQPKHKLKAEAKELQLEQQKLREIRNNIDKTIDKLKDEEIEALKNNDGVEIATIDEKIKNLKEKLERIEARHKANAEILECYSKVLKNNREGLAASITSYAGAITGLGGLAVGAIGLAAAYDGDREGKLIHKGTLDEARNMIGRFINGKKR